MRLEGGAESPGSFTTMRCAVFTVGTIGEVAVVPFVTAGGVGRTDLTPVPEES